MNTKRILRIGIRSYEDSKADLRALVRGQGKRREDDPSVWVTSLASLAQLLSDANLRLLETIRVTRPASITALARSVSREVPNLSRTLATMESYGLVEMTEGEGRQKAPRVTFDELDIVYRPRLGERQAAVA